MQLFRKRDLRDARLPHSPDMAMFKETILIGDRGNICRITYAALLRDLFHRAKDDIWKPKGTPASLHGGLIRQPARVLFLCAKMI